MSGGGGGRPGSPGGSGPGGDGSSYSNVKLFNAEVPWRRRSPGGGGPLEAEVPWRRWSPGGGGPLEAVVPAPWRSRRRRSAHVETNQLLTHGRRNELEALEAAGLEAATGVLEAAAGVLE
ncbi:unnamed protein product, partial [Boreogadus saida]